MERPLQPVGDRRCRHDCGTEPGEGQRREQAHAIDFGLCTQGDVGIGGRPFEYPAEGRTGRWEQQWYLVEVHERDDVAVGQGVAVGGEQQQVLRKQRLDDQLGFVDREVHDRPVELTGEHVRDQR